MLADDLDQAIGLRNLPRTHKVNVRTVSLTLVDPPNGSDQMQEDLRDGIAFLLHRQGILRHPHAAPVIAIKIGTVCQRVGCKQAQPLGQQRCIRIKFAA